MMTVLVFRMILFAINIVKNDKNDYNNIDCMTALCYDENAEKGFMISGILFDEKRGNE